MRPLISISTKQVRYTNQMVKNRLKRRKNRRIKDLMVVFIFIFTNSPDRSSCYNKFIQIVYQKIFEFRMENHSFTRDGHVLPTVPSSRKTNQNEIIKTDFS